MTKLTVSVIMPIYNRQRFVRKAVKMLQAQSLKEIEFLVVDDGSTDDTWNLLQQLTNGDHRFRILRNPQNKGPSVARNLALQKVRGKYVGFFDCDDAVSADYFEKLCQQAQENDADIVYTVYNKYSHSKGSKTSLSEKLDILRNGALWDKLYRTSLIKDNNLSLAEGLYCADNIFVVHIFYFAKKVFQTNSPVYHYALSRDSIGKDKAKQQKRKADILTVCEQILNFASQNKWSEVEQIALQKFLARSFNEYPKDQKFRAKLGSLLNLISTREQTMYGNVEKHSKIIKLFCLIPIYGWNQRGGKKVWKILGLPVFKIRRMSNGITTKYYILGVPVMKVSRKVL